MGKGPLRPYEERGRRLRDHRESLDKAGKLGTLKEWVTALGFTVSAYLAYERGEYWPKGEKKKRLAEKLGWTEIELDHGPQATDHLLSAREQMMLELFRGLTPQQQREWTLEILAQVEANRSIQKHVRAPLRTFSNEDVEAAFGKVPAPSKPKRQRRGAASAEEDPE